MKIILPMCFIAFLLSFPLSATEIVHKFKNPSFSGVGNCITLFDCREPRVFQEKGHRRGIRDGKKKLPRGKRTIRP